MLHFFKKVLIPSLLLLFPAAASAQLLRKDVQFEYNTFYEYYFENREFDYKVDSPVRSGTINAMSFTPSVGLSFWQGTGVNHRLTLGLDIRKDMGSGEGRYVDEVTVHYDGHVRLRDGSLFEGIIGVFPRNFSEGEYGRVFFSDSTRFVDRNIEGLLLKYRSRSLYAEIGADWMGQYGNTRKERFMIFSSLLWTPEPWLNIGFAGTFYHYAGSVQAPGVVDNDLLNPFIRVDFAKRTGMQELSLKAGLLGTYQWDREREESQTIRLGAEAVFRAGKRNIFITNTLFRGQGFQYLYSGTDLGGGKYGNNLYFGCPFYGYGVYDMAELSWTPKLGRALSLQLRARFHFKAGYDFSDPGFIGNTQTLGFVLDLDRLRHLKWGAGRIGEPVKKKTEHYYFL